MNYMIFKRLRRSITISFTACLLAACGGGGGDSPAVSNVSTSEVPLAATQEVGAAITFVKSVVDKGEANQDAPLVVGEAVLASSDDNEPVAGL